MKKLAVIVLLGTMVFSMAACANEADTADNDAAIIGEDESTWGPDLDEEDSTQEVNPIKEYDSMDEAAAAAGFSFTVPDEIEGYTDMNISLIDMDPVIFQVIYGNEESSVTIRKAEHSDDSDISGVYTEYSESSTVNDVALKGDDSVVYLANWTKDGYDYSVYADAGMSEDVILSIVNQVQ